MHALAGGQAVGLDDVRRRRACARCAAHASASSKTAAAAVATPASAMTCLAKLLLPSMRAAAADGPKQAMPGVAQRVGDAGDERHLGPDDDQVGAHLAGQRDDRRRRRRRRPRGDGASAAVPALPGAQTSPVTAGSRDSASSSACSRAPEPRTRTFTARNASGPTQRRAASAPGGARHDGEVLAQRRRPVEEAQHPLGRLPLEQPRRRSRRRPGARRRAPAAAARPCAGAARSTPAAARGRGRRAAPPRPPRACRCAAENV